MRREVVVDAAPDVAYRVFTERIGVWWPLADHGVFGGDSTVAFVDGRIVETSTDGDVAVWGTVLDARPGERLVFTWHPGRGPEDASEVTVTFTGVDGRTSVVLMHRGWEVFADPQAARDEYDHGWPGVLERFASDATGSPSEATDETQHTWVALLHTPGPSAPADGSVFDAPQFADHVEFLSRLREQGHLVAAGPFADADGSGMTILRLNGPGRLDEARTWATRDDPSVASGFFDVEVRSWHVVLEGSR